jgi:hypothetical protein
VIANARFTWHRRRIPTMSRRTMLIGPSRPGATKPGFQKNAGSAMAGAVSSPDLATRGRRDSDLFSPGVLRMKHVRSTLPGTAWVCLAATALLAQGCAPRTPQWDGIFTIDRAGGAKTCVAPSASPPNAMALVAQIQVSNEGGWCGVALNHGGAPYDSYLMVTRPAHGRVFAHRVGTNTRIDYTPDTGFIGTDSYAIRLIPGNAVVEGKVTVTQ